MRIACSAVSSVLNSSPPWVLLGSGTGVDAGTVDVALRGDHGLVAQELHQRVDADIRIGEFGGEGVAQAAWQLFVDISGYPRSFDSRSA